MPAKKAKGGSKAKKEAFKTDDEVLAPFGLKVKEIVRTPLGVTGEVLGVKLQDPADPQTARLWVRYSSGLEAPLEPQVSAGYIGGLGYRKVSDADHVARDVHDLEAANAAWEVRRKELLEEAIKKAAEAEDPAKGKDKKGGDAKKKKK